MPFFKLILSILLIILLTKFAYGQCAILPNEPIFNIKKTATCYEYEFEIQNQQNNVSYFWDFGDNSAQVTGATVVHLFNNLNEGNNFIISVIATDNNDQNCSTTSQLVTHSVTPFAALDFNGYNLFNCNASTRDLVFENITDISEGNIVKYFIDWGDGTGIQEVDSESKNYSYNNIGIFYLTYTVEDYNGCTNSTVYELINSTNLSLTVSSEGNTVDCAPYTICFPINMDAIMSNPDIAQYTINFGDSNIDTIIYHKDLEDEICHEYKAPSCDGAYIFSMTSSINGRCSTGGTVDNIIIYEEPQPSFTLPPNGCANNQISINNTTTSACINRLNYTWNITNLNNNLTNAIESDDGIDYIFTESGFYEVKLTAITNDFCESTSTSQQICIGSDNENLDVTIGIDQTEICLGETINLSATINAQNNLSCPITYRWQVTAPDNSTFIDTLITTTELPTLTNFTLPGNYTVQLTYGSGCITELTVNEEFTIIGLPMLTLPSQLTVCDELNYTIEPDMISNVNAITYQVLDEDENLIGSFDNNNLTFPYKGTFTIKAIAESCNVTEEATTNITIVDTANPEPVPTESVCLNQAPINLNQFADGSWSGSNLIQNQNTFLPNVANTYQLMVNQLLEGGCSVERDFELVVKAPPSFSYSTPDSVCLQNETINLNITPTGGEWNNPSIDENGLLNLQTGLSNFTYTFTDDENGCTIDTTITLQVYNVNNAIEFETIEICKGGGDIELPSTIFGGTWSGDTPITEDGIINSNNFIENNSYTFYYSTSTCTISDSIIANVIGNEPLLDVDTTVCTLDTLDLSGIINGATFEGSLGVENNLFLPFLSNNTLNTITVTKGSGSCIDTAYIFIEILPNPIKPSFIDEGPFCLQENIQLFVTTVGGNFNCQEDYLTCDGILMPNEPGNYEVSYQIINDDGCENSVTKDIIIDALPNAEINATTQQICIGDSIILNAVNPNEGNCKWQINGLIFNDCSIIFEGTTASEYTAYLTQTNNNNCAATDSISIKINDELNITQLNSDVFLCIPGTAEIEFDFTGEADSIIWNIGKDTIFGEITEYTFNPVLNDTLTERITVIVKNGCDADTATHDILLSPKPQINFLADSARICADTEISFNNGTLGNPYSTRWFVNGTLVSNDFELESQIFETENDSTVTIVEILLEATNNCGTTTKLDTLAIYPNLVSAFIQPAFSGDVVCVGDEIFFREASTNGTQIQWDFNEDSLVDSYNQDSTSYIYTIPGNYTVNLTADNGCGRAMDTLNLQVMPVPDVTIMYEDETPCIDDEVELRLEIEDRDIIESIRWVVNGDTVSTFINTRGRFNELGENTVEVIVTSKSGCVTTIKDTIFVDTPLPGIGFENKIEYPCFGSSIQLSAEAIDATDIIWTINNDTVGSGNNYTYQVNDLVPVNIGLITKNECGEMSDTIRIEPQPIPDIQLREPELIGDCYNQQFQFGFESSNQNISVLWNFGDGNTSTDFDPVHTYQVEGEYNITFTATEIDYGCETGVFNKTVFAYNEPLLTGLNDTTVCDGQDVYLPFAVTNAQEIVLMANGQPIQGSPNLLPVFYNEDTNIEVSVYYENTTTGCNETANATVTVCKLVEPAFSFSNNKPEINELITITNESQLDFNDEAEWYLDGVLTNLENGIYFSEKGTYVFELIITEETCGCITSLQKNIIIDGPYKIVSPNAMAPDQLSYFEPIGQGIDNYTMSIYSKWGELVYTTGNVVPADGNFESSWNGQWNNNGKNLPQGVYVYEILVTYFDATEDKIFGTVTLLK